MLPRKHFQLLKLDLVIRDINDNRPLFPKNMISINVSENAHRNDVIDLNAYQARDIDSGKFFNKKKYIVINLYWKIVNTSMLLYQMA